MLSTPLPAHALAEIAVLQSYREHDARGLQALLLAGAALSAALTVFFALHAPANSWILPGTEVVGFLAGVLDSLAISLNLARAARAASGEPRCIAGVDIISSRDTELTGSLMRIQTEGGYWNAHYVVETSRPLFALGKQHGRLYFSDDLPYPTLVVFESGIAVIRSAPKFIKHRATSGT